MTDRKQLNVYMNGQKVGTLAETKDHLTAFEYSDEWIASGFSISPFSLPIRKGVFIAKKYDPFDGLFGVFADSLPDGWGRLLADRFLRKNHVDPVTVSPLTRLAIVGDSGMGALEYRPAEKMKLEMAGLSLDEFAEECRKLFDTDQVDYLDDSLPAKQISEWTMQEHFAEHGRADSVGASGQYHGSFGIAAKIWLWLWGYL